MDDSGIIGLFFERSERAVTELERKYGPAAYLRAPFPPAGKAEKTIGEGGTDAMTREEVFEALGGVAGRHVAAAVRFDPKGAYALPERSAEMNKRRTIKRIAVTALAAAMLLALGATAWAAGWLDPIFGQAARKINTNDASEDRIEAAAAAVYEATQEPESRQLPAFDGSKLTLGESYYDGQGLLLGVDLDAARPGLCPA